MPAEIRLAFLEESVQALEAIFRVEAMNLHANFFIKGALERHFVFAQHDALYVAHSDRRSARKLRRVFSRLFLELRRRKHVAHDSEPQRIIGVTADIDDEHVVPQPTLTVYSTFGKGPMFGGRLFIHTSANPYALVTPVTRIIRGMSPEQPVERAATLEDIRAEVLTPDQLNTVVFGIFA